jgi:hypothetical protein
MPGLKEGQDQLIDEARPFLCLTGFERLDRISRQRDVGCKCAAHLKRRASFRFTQTNHSISEYEQLRRVQIWQVAHPLP